MGIVRLGALQIVDHEIAAPRLDSRLEPLDRGEQIGEILRPLVAPQWDPPPPQPIGDLCRNSPYVSAHTRTLAPDAAQRKGAPES